MSSISHVRNLLNKVQDEYESLWTAHATLQDQHRSLAGSLGSSQSKLFSPRDGSFQLKGTWDSASVDATSKPAKPLLSAKAPGCNCNDNLIGPSCDLVPAEPIPGTAKPRLLSGNGCLQDPSPYPVEPIPSTAKPRLLSGNGCLQDPSPYPSLCEEVADELFPNWAVGLDPAVKRPAGKVAALLSRFAPLQVSATRAMRLSDVSVVPQWAESLVFDEHGSCSSQQDGCNSCNNSTMSEEPDWASESAPDPLAKLRRESTKGVDSTELATGSHLTSVFPIWWNPSKNALCEIRDIRQSSAMGRVHLLDKDPNSVDRCVLSPVSIRRLLWDFLSGCFILYDAWATPFEIFYCSETARWNAFEVGNWIIVGFFACDILLNFNTGYVIKDKIMLKRGKIIRNYLKLWFWLDLFATVPFDQLFNVGQMGRSLRFFKAVKALKTIRFFKLVQTLRALRNPHNDHYLNIIKSYKSLSYSIVALVIVLFFVHIHTCIWASLKTDAVAAEEISQAFDAYFQDFQSVYLLAISSTAINAQTRRMQVFEMLLATEHSVILIFLTAWAVFKAIMVHGDAARAHLMHEQSLRYMRRHRLSSKTQIQVLYGLHEAGSAKAMQKDFINLMESDLPQELQRKISYELWGAKLKTLGLIELLSDWDDDVVRSLALMCREEVLATNSVLFSEEDSSFAAYHVINGEVGVNCPLIEEAIPNFGAGTWLGESALVNPCFRRGLSATAACLASVMLVPAEGFQKLVREAGLSEPYEHFVKEELWRGLCGRCGTLGNHFSDNCPSIARIASVGSKKSVRRSRIPTFLASMQEHMQEPVQRSASTADREFSEFLRSGNTDHLREHLEEMGICDLDALENLNIDALREHLSRVEPSITLAKAHVRALSSKSIQYFRQKMEKGKARMMVADSSDEHLLFLSHYKLEAGTEAALMRSELEQLIAEDPGLSSSEFQVPVFLDSEDLTNLKELEHHVKRSHNVALLLTRGVLTRPWCLVEIVIAVKSGIPVVLVEVAKRGNEFKFPDNDFFKSLADGSVLDNSAMQVLASCGIDFAELESTIREIFKSIAVPYSPHRPLNVRRAELETLLRQCRHHEQEQTSVRKSGSLNDGGVQRRASNQLSRKNLISFAAT